MATIVDVLNFLRPEGGYVAYGLEFEGIEFIECEPFTKEEFEAAFLAYKVWKTEEEKTKTTEKAALLAKLGITEDEARLLLG